MSSMHTAYMRHWDAPLIPTRLEQQIRKSERQRERQPQQVLFNQCIMRVFHPHILKFCSYQTRVTLSHTCSRLFFLLSSSREVWDDLLDRINTRVADIDVDMKYALEESANQAAPRMRHVSVSKSDVQSLLALRKPDETLQTLLRVLRCLLFDTKFEKWDKHQKDTRMTKRDLVYEQMMYHFDVEKVSPYNRKVINKFVPKMDLNVMRRKSASCGSIVEWLQAIHEYLKLKEQSHAFDAEQLYQQKLKLCRQLALIQKKLEYQWSFAEPDPAPLQLQEEDGEYLSGDEEDDGDNDVEETEAQMHQLSVQESSEWEELRAPGRT